MAGGLFSMDRSFFFELGAYDPDMDIWGGENLELSFRVWQCGGRVEILPCSHVGHVFRHASPHEFPKGGNSAGRVLNANLARVSEVWMDQWRHFFHKVAPQAMALVHSLDVSERMELKRKLGCKDFGWDILGYQMAYRFPELVASFSRYGQKNGKFLENVWPDHFLPPLSTDDSSSIFGRFRHISSNSCLLSRPSSAGKKHRLNVGQCSLGFDLWQFWVLSAHGKDGFRQMSDEHQCLSAIEEHPQKGHWRIQLKECGEHDMEFWRLDGRGRFVHQKSGLCLDEPKGNESVNDEFEQQIGKSNIEDGHKIPTLSKCGWGKQSQKWEMIKVEWLPAEKKNKEIR